MMEERKESPDYENFLKEYGELCVRYGIIITACGCCDSPWMIEPRNNEEIRDNIIHLGEDQGHGFSYRIPKELKIERDQTLSKALAQYDLVVGEEEIYHGAT